MTTNLPEQRQPSSEVLSKAQKLEQLRRKIAAIPAGNNVDALPESIAEPVRKVETPASTDTTRSTLRVLPVPDPIAALLPHRGLARGAVAAVDGAASILVGLLAAATAAGHRAAVIGLPRLGLLAVTEHGGDLSRIALIPDPRDAAVEVAAIMLDGVDVVVLGLSGAAVTPSRARAVTARARSVDRTIARHAYVHDSAAPNEAVDISGAEGGVGSVRKCGSQDRGFGGGPLGLRGAS